MPEMGTRWHWVAWPATGDVGLSEAEVAKMSKNDAITRMQEHWSGPPDSDAAR
jgi:hypothetical protein